MSVINFTTLKPLDEELIRHYASSAKRFLSWRSTHQRRAGLGGGRCWRGAEYPCR